MFVSPYCFGIKGRLQDLTEHSARHSKRIIFRVLSRFFLCVILLYRFDASLALFVNHESFLYHFDTC